MRRARGHADRQEQAEAEDALVMRDHQAGESRHGVRPFRTTAITVLCASVGPPVSRPSWKRTKMLSPNSAAVPMISGSAHTLARLKSRPKRCMKPSVHRDSQGERRQGERGSERVPEDRRGHDDHEQERVQGALEVAVPDEADGLVARDGRAGDVGVHAPEIRHEALGARLLPDVDGRVDAEQVAPARSDVAIPEFGGASPGSTGLGVTLF